MPFSITEYALLASEACIDRLVGASPGTASVLKFQSDGTSGFYAVAYQVGTDIVISYRGTNDPTDVGSYDISAGDPTSEQALLARTH